MTGPEGKSEFLFPENLNVSRDEISRFEGNKIRCSPRDQSLSELLYSKTKPKAKFENRAEIPAIKCNSGQHFAGNSKQFPV